MQVGDTARIFLDTTANPDFPEYVDATVVAPLKQTKAKIGYCFQTFTTYTFQYLQETVGEALTTSDVLNVACISCCDSLDDRFTSVESAAEISEALVADAQEASEAAAASAGEATAAAELAVSYLSGNVSVDTIAALRLFPSGGPFSLASVKQCYVRSHTVKNDGGEGVFRWNAASTAPDNNGTIIKPASVSGGSPGRWERIYEPRTVYAAWFGIDGNRNEAFATSNRIAIQSAHDALPIVMPGLVTDIRDAPLHEGKVILPPGDISVDGTIYSGPGVAIHGSNSFYGATYIRLKQGVWTNPAEEHWLWYVETMQDGQNVSFGAQLHHVVLICGGTAPGFNDTGNNPNPNYGASGLYMKGAEHMALDHVTINDIGLRGAVLSGEMTIPWLNIYDVQVGPALTFENEAVQGAVLGGKMDISHQNFSAIGGEAVPYVLIKNTLFRTDYLRGEVFQGAANFIRIEGCTGCEIGTISANMLGGFASGSTVVKVRGTNSRHSYGPMLISDFDILVDNDDLNGIDGGAGVSPNQIVKLATAGNGYRYNASQDFSLARVLAGFNVDAAVDGSTVNPGRELIRIANKNTLGVVDIDIEHHQFFNLFLRTQPKDNSATKSLHFVHLESDGNFAIYTGNGNSGPFSFLFTQTGDFHVRRTIMLGDAAYANDAAATAGGVPINGMYRRSDGVVAWRLT